MVAPIDRLTGPVRRRVRVLQVRQELERVSAALAAGALGVAPETLLHQNVAHRLMLLTAGVAADEWPVALALARRARRVYRDTSVVLHSNRAFGDVPEQLVREWEGVVVQLRVATAHAARVAEPR